MHSTVKKVLLASSLIVTPYVFVSSANADELPPFEEAATVAPAVSSPAEVVDGITFRTAVWENFQLTVRECMEWEGWTYDMPPVPTWWEPAFDENGATGIVQPEYVEPAPLNLNPEYTGPKRFPPAYTEALRGLDGETPHPDDNGTREFIAHDSINSPFYGGEPSDTGGCEAEARIRIVEPALDAQEDLMNELYSQLQGIIGNPDEITDMDEAITEVLTSPAGAAVVDDVIEDNPETVLDAGGNYGR